MSEAFPEGTEAEHVTDLVQRGEVQSVGGRVEVGYAEWERQPGEAVNTSENNGFDVGGSVELSFEATGISMLEVCGTGEYWFGRSNYSDNPSKTIATELPIVSLCTEIDMARDQDDGQPRAESRKVQ